MEQRKDYRLPRAFAEKWLKALRSGEYRQGVGALYAFETDQYCCLGVACRVCGIPDEMIQHYAMPSLHMFHDFGVDYQEGESYLGLPVQLVRDPDSLGSALADALASMNDNAISFSEIAEWIEQNVEFIG